MGQDHPSWKELTTGSKTSFQIPMMLLARLAVGGEDPCLSDAGGRHRILYSMTEATERTSIHISQMILKYEI